MIRMFGNASSRPTPPTNPSGSRFIAFSATERRSDQAQTCLRNLNDAVLIALRNLVGLRIFEAGDGTVGALVEEHGDGVLQIRGLADLSGGLRSAEDVGG
jgi:hypothetical protein